MQHIGRYQITGELGRGAMGIVYRALDPSIGRIVAIKTIRLTEFVDPSEQTRLRDRLFREAQSAGVLSHPNIVTVYDVDEENNVAYIAMEFVDGPTLDRLHLTGPINRDTVINVLAQTASALDYAHARGVVHRDIKPGNIMLHERSTVKITDFGVARLQSHQLTQAGMLVGTPNYMAPEQVQGMGVEGNADQFALGVIAYELLTGERPFAGESLATVIYRIVNDEPVAPRRLNPTLGAPVDPVIRRALAKKPGDRFPTCTAFVEALDDACSASGEWRPLAPGAGLALPTMVEGRSGAADVTGSAVTAPVVITRPLPETPAPVFEQHEETPALLRWARRAAVVILAAGTVAMLIFAAREWNASREPEQEMVKSEPAAPHVTSRPEPVNPPAAEPEETPAPPRRTPTGVPAPSRPATDPPSTSGEMRVVTSPPGASVEVAGQNCTTPCTLRVPPGRHSVTATLAGHRRALRVIEAPRDAEIFLHMERSAGTLAVRSTPPGATIILNGQERAEKTPTVLNLPVGRYKLEVVREGSGRDVEEVDIKDSVITNVDVNFTGR
jgi:predicted Ser/Thr protein kinase